jgi:hypothetical protein
MTHLALTADSVSVVTGGASGDRAGCGEEVRKHRHAVGDRRLG